MIRATDATHLVFKARSLSIIVWYLPVRAGIRTNLSARLAFFSIGSDIFWAKPLASAAIHHYISHKRRAPRNEGMGEQTGEHPIRLVLVDDHTLFRASLARFLASEPGLEVASECGTSSEALEALKNLTVDVVLLDFALGSERASDFMSAARQAGYQGRFLIVAGTTDPSNAALALKLGAAGIFLKSDAADRLVQAIRLVANGGVWVDQKMIQLLADRLVEERPYLADRASNTGLNDGERKVLLGILGGLTNKKIGGNMGLSESSVKAIVQRLFAKAGVRTRSQLVRVALEGSLAVAGWRPDSANLSSAGQPRG